MKRYFILLIIISLTITSCHTPSYTFERTSSKYFKVQEGKYLLNTIEASEAVRLDMREMIVDKFEDENIVSLQNASVRLIPSEIPLNPDQEIINQLKESAANFDFIINVIAIKKSDNVQNLVIGNLEPSDKNIVTVALEIIDLQDEASVYFARVRSELSNSEDNKDFSFAVDTNTMLKKSLKKILKRIEKN